MAGLLWNPNTAATVAIAKLFFYAQEAKMELIKIMDCCGLCPKIKENHKKHTYKLECEYCGLIIGNYDDFGQAVNNWNLFQTIKEQPKPTK